MSLHPSDEDLPPGTPVLIGRVQTPHRFRTKRQFWADCGLALEMRDSGEYRLVGGQVERRKRPAQIRGLNWNHNHELKNLFKAAATTASFSNGVFREFYLGLLKKNMRPEMARLTLARKIAAIALKIWKKGEAFDAEHLKLQAARAHGYSLGSGVIAKIQRQLSARVRG
jgi:hypothetical protein